MITNALERAQVKMPAQTHSLRQIANHYHDLKQALHGPISTKIVSKIVKAGSPLNKIPHYKLVLVVLSDLSTKAEDMTRKRITFTREAVEKILGGNRATFR